MSACPVAVTEEHSKGPERYGTQKWRLWRSVCAAFRGDLCCVCVCVCVCATVCGAFHGDLCCAPERARACLLQRLKHTPNAKPRKKDQSARNRDREREREMKTEGER